MTSPLWQGFKSLPARHGLISANKAIPMRITAFWLFLFVIFQFSVCNLGVTRKITQHQWNYWSSKVSSSCSSKISEEAHRSKSDGIRLFGGKFILLFLYFLGWHWALTNFAIECWGEALHNIIYLPLTFTNKQSAAFNPKGNRIDRYWKSYQKVWGFNGGG